MFDVCFHVLHGNRVTVEDFIQKCPILAARFDARKQRIQSFGYVAGASEDEFESPAEQLADTGDTNLPDNGISVTSSRAGTLLRIVGHANPKQLQPAEAEPR